MEPVKTSVIILGLNTILFAYILSAKVSAPITIVLGLMALLLLVNIYKVGDEYIHLEKAAARNKKKIAHQKKEIYLNKKKLERILEEISRKDREKIKSELGSTNTEITSRESRFQDTLWNQLEKTTTPKQSENARLNAQRKEIEELINVTKKKYTKRQLDEDGFRGIVRDYQKQLIEIENKIKKTSPKKR